MINPHHRWFIVILLGLGLADAAIATDVPMPPNASFTIESIALKEARPINVYTPPGYDASATARYPVLYMPDGGLQEDFPHVIVDIDAAIREGQVRPMIVIGIENTERRRDMTGPTTVASDRKIAPHVGGSAAFRSFIAEELMPKVRRRYRTDGQTAIIGESLAGLFVVETFLERPELFDTWIALSPSLWWNNGSLARGAAARLRAWPNIHRTLYLSSAGDDDIGNAMNTLQAALRSTRPQGLTWYDEPRPDLHHGDIYRRSSPGIFRKLFPAIVRQGFRTEGSAPPSSAVHDCLAAGPGGWREERSLQDKDPASDSGSMRAFASKRRERSLAIFSTRRPDFCRVVLVSSRPIGPTRQPGQT